MKAAIASFARSVCSATGSVLAGNTGDLIGTVLGPLLASVLPFGSGIVVGVLAKMASQAIENAAASTASKIGPAEKQRINHDLQTAFRDALREALIDLGGRRSFPQAWRPAGRDVPAALIFTELPAQARRWREGDPLAGQVTACFQGLADALNSGKILPLDPGPQQPAADVRRYLESGTAGELAGAFHEQVVRPGLAAYGALLAEEPELEAHLRRHLLDRTLVHLGEALKQRPAAWRAFNRLMLEGMRDQVRDVAGGQQEVVARLDALLARDQTEGIAAWSEGIADLLAATGRIEKRLDEGLGDIADRIAVQHKDVVGRLDGLLVVAVRIETKVDRVLRILEDGRYIIEGQPSVNINEPPAPGAAPYKGLQFFDHQDADLFFGRELLTARLAGQLRQHNFLAVVVGASGSGKSSVVRAGLIPALQRGAPLADGTLPPQGSASWPVHIITPTGRPLEALAASLTRDAASVTAAAALAADLRRDPASLGLYVRKLLAAAAARSSDRLLLVVDQFEELFTLCADAAERKAFVDALLTAVGEQHAAERAPAAGRGEHPTTVVITLRADFYHHCAQYRNLRAALERCQAYIGPMDRDELRRAIEEPARLGGWQFERGLVDLMLRDVGDEPGALPLLSHALLETWQRRRGRVMTLESYAEAGGVRGAIARTADAVYLGLTPAQQAMARAIFLRLTELGEGTQDTRRRAELAELLPSPADAAALRQVLQILTNARLVTTDQDVKTGVETAEVAHEALIREWPRLRSWLDEDRAGLRVHRQLTQAAQEWLKLGRDPGSLYRGVRLAEAGEYAESHSAALNAVEWKFLTTSQEAVAAESFEREAQRQRELQAARRLAEEQKQRAEAQAQRAAAETQRATAEAERAAAQARAAAQLRRRAWLLIGALGLVAVLLVLAIVAAVTAQRNRALADARRLEAVAAQETAEAERSRADEQRDAARAAEAVAVAERSRAETQAHLAFGRQLAAASANNLTVDPERSILLALEAIAQTQAVTTTIPPDVEDALQRSVQLSRVLVQLPNQRGSVYDVAFSPDGTRLATAGQEVARIWDAASGEPLTVLSGHADWIRSVAYSPDGQRVATAGDDGLAILWDAEDGRRLLRLEHGDSVRSAVFTPDGGRLVTGCFDGSVRVWDLATGQAVLALEHGSAVHCVAIDPAGKRIVAGNDAGAVRIWDAASGDQLMKWSVGALPVFAVEFSADGGRVVTATENRAQMWALAAGADPEEVLAVYDGDTIFATALHPNGRYLATARADGEVSLWDVASETPDERLVFSLHGQAGGSEGVAFSPDGSRIASASYDGSTRIWDASVALSRAISNIGFSTDGRVVETIPAEGRVVLWNPDTGAMESLLALPGAIAGIDTAPDAARAVLIGQEARAMTVWDTASGSLVATIPYEQAIRSLSLSRDGTRLAFVDQDQAEKVRVWDAAGGGELLTLSGHTNWINEVELSPDGTLLASGAADYAAKIWDAATGAELHSLEQQGTIAVRAVEFSRDAARLATAGDDGSVTQWDVRTGESLGRFAAHTHAINDIEFSSDGRLLATASDDKRIRVWDVSSAVPLLLRTFTQPNEVSGVDLSPDASRLLVISAKSDPPAAIYRLDLQALLVQARARVTRALTDAECSEYLQADVCPAMPGVPPRRVLSDPLPYVPDFTAADCGGWDEYAGESANAGCDDGEYRFTVVRENWWAWSNPGRYFTDFDLEVDAALVSGPRRSDYGLVLRYVDGDNFYVFELSGEGNYRIGSNQDDRYTALAPWTDSDAILTGGATNRLRVRAEGDRFTFYVNGQQLAEVTDDLFPGGDIGLIAGTPEGEGQAEIRFSGLAVRPLE